MGRRLRSFAEKVPTRCTQSGMVQQPGWICWDSISRDKAVPPGLTCFATPNPRLIPKGEKPESFTGLALAPNEDRIKKAMNKPTEKSRKSNVAPIKPEAATVHPEPTLVDLVLQALVDYANWVGDTERGVMTPVQFLAVVLWMIRTETATPADEEQIINGWGGALREAARLQLVAALHPVTLLPLAGAEDPKKWLMSVVHADNFLEQMPIGFSCSKVLAHWRDVAAAQSNASADVLTYEQAREQRKKAGKGSTWTDLQRDAVHGEIRSRQGEKMLYSTIALDLGISEQALRIALSRGGQKGPEKTRVGEPASWLVSGFGRSGS